MKPRRGSPDILRKGGAHENKRRETGRERVERGALDSGFSTGYCLRCPAPGYPEVCECAYMSQCHE